MNLIATVTSEDLTSSAFACPHWRNSLGVAPTAASSSRACEVEGECQREAYSEILHFVMARHRHG